MNGNSQDLQHKITSYWPIIVTVLAITVTAAQANTRLDNLNDRIEYVYTNGAPITHERLVRMETQQAEMAKTLERMEKKLDDERTVNPRTRDRLRGL